MTASLWQATAEARGAPYPPLAGNIETHVLIIGGGITGVTCAALLAAAGRPVVLLEAHTVGAGTTGSSTGNLYEVLNDGLAPVARTWGNGTVSDVAASRREAIALVEAFAGEIGGDTCFRRCPLYQYSEHDRLGLENEYAVLRAAGLAPQMAVVPLPEGPQPAMVLDGQAQFHPLNYVRRLADRASTLGARIHENSGVIEISGDHHVAHTLHGRVSARDVVLATHTPKGIFGIHAQMLTHREYGVACESPETPLPPGIFWERGPEGCSWRSLDVAGRSYLIGVAAGGTTGSHDPEHALATLESRLPCAARYRWSAQGYRSPDELPYIGRSPLTETYIATGFHADGLTFGTLAAQIIADDILGKPSRWRSLYRANRLTPIKSASQIVEEQTLALKGLIQDRFGLPTFTAATALPPGHGAVMRIAGHTAALYRDYTGRLHAVSAACTHLGCMVHWNAVEKSWDCPCHGSRFDVEGQIIEGPALIPLKPVRVPD